MEYVLQEMDGSGHNETVLATKAEFTDKVQAHLEAHQNHYAAVGSDKTLTKLVGRGTQEVMEAIEEEETKEPERLRVLFIPQVQGGDGVEMLIPMNQFALPGPNEQLARRANATASPASILGTE